MQHGAARQWSAVDAAPYFTYTATNGVRHLVWYNDAESTKAKMALIQKYGLRGLVFWAVGEEDAAAMAGPARVRHPAQRHADRRRSQAVTTYGSAVTVTGKLTASRHRHCRSPAGPCCCCGRPPGPPPGVTWRPAAPRPPAPIALKYTPPANGSFRLVSYSSWEWLSGASPTATTLVRWRLSAAFTDNTVTRGTRVYLRGSVAPIRTGTPVQLHRLVNGVWQSATTPTTVASNGTYVFSFVWPIAGTYTYRVVVPATALNSAATSPNLPLYVS